MLNIEKELKTKLLAAQSAEVAAELVKADGQEITPEERIHLWEEIKKGREQEGRQLSPDELEAVIGGADRDWYTDGCEATVGAGSWCGSNDCCYIWDVVYEHLPVGECAKCGGVLMRMWTERVGGLDETHYQCARCGREFVHTNSSGEDYIGKR